VSAPTETSLHGKTAVVTGASRGIGAVLAARLTALGVRVALVARSVEPLNVLAAELGATALAVPCDVSNEAEVARMAEAVTRAFGVPDILVNNAGIFQIAPLSSMSAKLFTDTLNINLLAPFLTLRAFLPGMQQRGSGHVLTVGSVADRAIFAENGAYSAAKYGARALHEVLRTETRGTGIRATLVSPSAVDTPIWNDILAEQTSHVRQLPTRDVMLSASDIADAAIFALTRPTLVNIDELRLTHS
jgi:NADP-dependent 3-hydroxy acid dehydrogenase YdfG